VVYITACTAVPRVCFFATTTCTGSFTRAIGLLCAHICDIKRSTGSLIPLGFHKHWFWEREGTLRPLLDPQWAGRERNANVRKSHAGRILSTGEELRIHPVYHRWARKYH
jgi:hypothetical protein